MSKSKMRHSVFWKLLIGVNLMILLFSACTSQSAPLRIKDISVNPDPVIGQTAVLHVEVVSEFDESNAAIIVDLPPGVKLMDGELLWEGSLKADQPQSHELSICVLYEGDWRIWIAVQSEIAEDSFYGETETLHLITAGDTVRIIPGNAYRITQPPDGMVVFPTDLPEKPPTDICP